MSITDELKKIANQLGVNEEEIPNKLTTCLLGKIAAKLGVDEKTLPNKLICTYLNKINEQLPTNKPYKTWDDIDFDEYMRVPTGYGTYDAENGIDFYYWSENPKFADFGLWHLNRQTGKHTQLIEGFVSGLLFHEDSKGNIYMQSEELELVYHIKGTKITEIFETLVFNFYEDKQGNVYAWGETVKGLFLLDGATVTQIADNNSFEWKGFCEDNKGNVYALANKTIHHIKGKEVTSILTIGINGILDFFKDSKENLYLSITSSEVKGLYYAEGTELALLTEGLNAGQWTLFEDSKGNVYATTNQTTGLFHLNGKEITKIYETGILWTKHREDSKGNLYIGNSGTTSPLAEKGLLYVDGKTAVRIWEEGVYWTDKEFHEDSKGNVYAYSVASSGVGLLHLNGDTATQVIDRDCNWKHFYEDSKGNVYVSSSVKNTNLYHLNGTTATKVTEGKSDIHSANYFETSDGNLFAKTKAGLYHLNGTTATRSMQGSYDHNFVFYEAKNGNLYCTNRNSGYEGLYCYNGSGWDVVVEGTTNAEFFEDSKGNVYSFSYYGYGDVTGVFILFKDENIGLIEAKTVHTIFEDSKGNVYVSVELDEDSGAEGLYHLDGDTVTHVLDWDAQWRFFHEDSKGNVYVSGAGEDSGLWLLRGTTAYQLIDYIQAWQNFIEKDNKIYVCSEPYPKPNVEIKVFSMDFGEEPDYNNGETIYLDPKHFLGI